MLSYFIKNLIGCIFKLVGYPFLLRKGDIYIFMFHRVVDEKDINDSDPALILTKRQFERKLRFISKFFKVVDLYDWVKKPTNEKCCAITFDDGWADNYYNALPILKKMNLPATIFLSTGMIDSDKTFWFDDLYKVFHRVNYKDFKDYILRLFPDINSSSENSLLIQVTNKFKEMTTADIESTISQMKEFFEISKNSIPCVLSWEQINAMGDEQIRFGSHGVNHVLLTTLKTKDKEFEISESKRMIEENVNNIVPIFSFPNGNYDQDTIDISIRNGYSIMVNASINDRSVGQGGILLNRINIPLNQSNNQLFFKIFQARCKLKTNSIDQMKNEEK